MAPSAAGGLPNSPMPPVDAAGTLTATTGGAGAGALAAARAGGGGGGGGGVSDFASSLGRMRRSPLAGFVYSVYLFLDTPKPASAWSVATPRLGTEPTRGRSAVDGAIVSNRAQR